MNEIYLLALALNFYLVGLIWVIQSVHYPTFHFVDSDAFKNFAHFHQSAITKVVGAPMLMELILSIILLWNYQFDWKLGTILFINIFIWMSTFFVSVPLHSKLLIGYKKEWADRLVLTNWPRTLAWTLKGLLMLYWINHYVVFS